MEKGTQKKEKRGKNRWKCTQKRKTMERNGATEDRACVKLEGLGVNTLEARATSMTMEMSLPRPTISELLCPTLTAMPNKY